MALLIAAAVVLGFVVWTFWIQPPREARAACTEWVEGNLKAPSTAEFTDVETTSKGDGRYEVTGSVDAENGFGAKLRVNFSCAVVNGFIQRSESRVGS